MGICEEERPQSLLINAVISLFSNSFFLPIFSLGLGLGLKFNPKIVILQIKIFILNYYLFL
jgi:hypothetical protein